MAAPLIASPSTSWDGIDGLWSTIILRVGSPFQNLRALVSLAGQEAWVIVPQGCNATLHPDYPSNCVNSRGGNFEIGGSQSWTPINETWNNNGIYVLGDNIGLSLGLVGNGYYGFDKAALQWSSNATVVNRTIVAGTPAKDYWVSMLGISPRPTNFTAVNNNATALEDPQPSFFSILRSTGQIPSLSYSFQPGSYYRYSTSVKNAFVSLIFGGYDSSRFVPNDVQFTFSPDDGRELIVGLQSITQTSRMGSNTLLEEGILATLDSTQAHTWLPIPACQAFEHAFNLTWDNTTSLYPISNELHQSLLAQSPAMIFELGNAVKGGPTVKITIPYAAFRLQALPPYSGITNSTFYFPLKRAANSSQYTLGRAFLQEVYLIADYERRTFNVSQAVWNDSVPSEIKTIATLSANTSNRSLSKSAVVGLIVGIVVPFVLLCVGLYLGRRGARRMLSTLYAALAKASCSADRGSESTSGALDEVSVDATAVKQIHKRDGPSIASDISGAADQVGTEVNRPKFHITEMEQAIRGHEI